MAATCIIQPIDMVKVRIQIGAKGGPVSVSNPDPKMPALTIHLAPLMFHFLAEIANTALHGY